MRGEVMDKEYTNAEQDAPKDETSEGVPEETANASNGEDGPEEEVQDA